MYIEHSEESAILCAIIWAGSETTSFEGLHLSTDACKRNGILIYFTPQNLKFAVQGADLKVVQEIDLLSCVQRCFYLFLTC
jgi:hypothetical protein